MLKIALPLFFLLPSLAFSAERTLLGAKAQAGGRYDDVRMCVGSPPGSQGGPAMDIAVYLELPLDGKSLHITLPIMRPILFGGAFRMLQFEPDLALLLHLPIGTLTTLIGPSFGAILHYGPDYRSEQEGDGRTPAFFAWGPKLGAQFGIEMGDEHSDTSFRLVLTSYVAPLFSVGDRDQHYGVVVGGALEGQLGFAIGP